MNSYKATPHNPPLTHADVKVSTSKKEAPETAKQERSESKKVKAREKAQGID